MNSVLDKIEDTYSQMQIRGQYEEEKRKSKLVNEQFQFKEVDKSQPIV